MIKKYDVIRILALSLAAVWLLFALSTPSDAGWLKKAKKAAKKAAHNVEKNLKAEAKRAGENISREAKRIGGDISRESKRFGGDVSREGKKLGGDISSEGKKFAGDISRESKKLGGDISSEGKKFLGDISDQSKRDITWKSGFLDPADNIRGAGDRLAENLKGGAGQLGRNLTQGERLLTHNIDGGLDSLGRNLFGQPLEGAFGAKLYGTLVFGPAALFGKAVQYDNLGGGLTQLGKNIRGGIGNVGGAAGSEWERGYRNVWNETVGAPRVTDTKKTDDQEMPTGKVANAETQKGKTKIGSEDAGDAPVAIFRAETSTGTKGSTGDSSTIFREPATSGLSSSPRKISESPGLGSSPTSTKKESGSPLSTGGPPGGSLPRKR